MFLRFLRVCVPSAVFLLGSLSAVAAQPALGDANQAPAVQLQKVELGEAAASREAPPSGSCDGSANVLLALVGPGDSCCQRHLDFCESRCLCGFSAFSCWDNGRGGCSSTCTCHICSV